MNRSLKIPKVVPASLAQKGVLDFESEVLGSILTGDSILSLAFVIGLCHWPLMPILTLLPIAKNWNAKLSICHVDYNDRLVPPPFFHGS